MWYTHHIGGYPHPDVPCVPKTALVQGEIYYCPDLKFIAYDVAVKHGTDRGRYIGGGLDALYVSALGTQLTRMAHSRTRCPWDRCVS